MKNTHIIRKLTDIESYNIYQDLEKVKDYFGFHAPGNEEYSKYGGLRDGDTVWLHLPVGDFFHRDRAYNIIELIDRHSKLLGNKQIGRTYIHRLKPNQKIFKHKDVDEEYFYTVDRYQIILDLPKKIKINQKGSVVSEFSLVYFNHFVKHAYSNDSDKDWYLIVFDLYKNHN